MSIELNVWIAVRERAAMAGENPVGEDALAYRGEDIGGLPEVPGAWVGARVCDEEDRAYAERWLSVSATHWIWFQWDKKAELEHVLDQACEAIGQLFRRIPDAPGVLDLNGNCILLRRDESGIVLDSEDDFWTEHRRRLLGSPYRLAPLNEDA